MSRNSALAPLSLCNTKGIFAIYTYSGDFRASEGREWTREEPGGQPVQVMGSSSSAGFAAREPGQSDAAETCTVSHGWVVLPAGAGAPAQVKTSKSLEFSFRRTSLGPDVLLSDTWAQLSQPLKTANPICASQIPPLEGLWLRLANFVLKLGSFPNIDKP